MTPASVDGGPVPKNPYEPPKGLAGHDDPCQLCVYGCPRRAWKEGFDAARPTGDAPPCRCGSGAHPRRCEVHPQGYDLHRAELTIESLTEELEHVRSRDAALREEGRVQGLRDGLGRALLVLAVRREVMRENGILSDRDVETFGKLANELANEFANDLTQQPTPDASQGSAPVDRFADGWRACQEAATEACRGLSPEVQRNDFDRGRSAAVFACAYAIGTTNPPSAPPAAPQGSPLPGGAVPRGHCNRCERCGWDVSDERGRCRPKDCSMRPMPPPRTHCAGCGVVFDDVVTPGNPPEGCPLPVALALVHEQAEDAGLWFVGPKTAAEAYLQRALRALHAAVEASQGNPPDGRALEGGAWPKDTVEVVARAIFAADALHSEGGGVAWDGITAEYQEDMRAVALAALAAAATPEGRALEGAGSFTREQVERVLKLTAVESGVDGQRLWLAARHALDALGLTYEHRTQAHIIAVNYLLAWRASQPPVPAIPQSGTVKEGTDGK